MHVIIGGTGNVGRQLSKVLVSQGQNVKVTSRRVQAGNSQIVQCNPLIAADVNSALTGARVAYLVVGLPYNANLWQKQWPVIMQNVLNACRSNNCKLVFLDNVYAYGVNSLANMCEDAALTPPSKKGEVRAQILQMALDAMQHQPVAIARSADFYGPGCSTSVLNTMVLNKVAKQGKAMWQGNSHQIHSFTYLPDIARALAILSNASSAFGQTWHLPTSAEMLTGHNFIQMAAQLAGAQPRYSVMPVWAMRAGGLFVPLLRELAEMAYQYTNKYFFNSRKFERAFNFIPTPYSVGIAESIQAGSKGEKG